MRTTGQRNEGQYPALAWPCRHSKRSLEPRLDSTASASLFRLRDEPLGLRAGCARVPRTDVVTRRVRLASIKTRGAAGSAERASYFALN